MGDNTNRVKPILFSGEMVRALLEGRKTQTRRVLKVEMPDKPSDDNVVHAPIHDHAYLDAYCGECKTQQNPRGMSPEWAWWTRDNRPGPLFLVGYSPGDLLYVRETWGTILAYDDWQPRKLHPNFSVGYAATAEPGTWCQTGCNGAAGRWRPSIHMPRWASRITLEVTDVRVRRLQEISEEDAIAEGCRPFFDKKNTEQVECPNGKSIEMQPLKGPSEAFRDLWDGLNEKRGYGWDVNPWVVAVTFKLHEINVDEHLKAAAPLHEVGV